jgi:two-component system KDP operon response regulator KdpE
VGAVNGEQGISPVALTSPDVIVLDLGLLDVDGLTVCKRIRQWNEVPIIILSASDNEDRKVDALNGGADDYVTKPFGIAEYEARIRAAIRHRSLGSAESELATISVGSLEFTAREFELLSFLTRHAGKICTHQMILSAAWGPGYSQEGQYLRTYVHRLRQKLHDESGTLIRTAPGIGYRIQP